ncbi:MAG: SPFH domain-containing protein [Cytophagales bacterium]|jgi:regulator of protease activity HflC (stomatin/prohibitin superfamily)|nr:SPFH domain-containing protein [Cytophagales bacterium]
MKPTVTVNRFALFAFLLVSVACSRVQPNYEGILMENYGRNGKEDFKKVTGSQSTWTPGTELYQVPMWEQKADPQGVGVTARDGGYFSVDPTYTYQAVRGAGVDIIFNYKHVGLDQSMMDNIESQILNPVVLNAYREEARNFTTDSLLNNLNAFEGAVEKRLKEEFNNKFFTLTSLTSGLKPPASMIAAIERRNNAIQQAEQVRNELEVARMQLEKAKIEAEENRVRASGLTQQVLQEKWIEALRTTQNRVIITDGKTPVILGNQ